ncbi:4Fe-4S binding protein [Moorellaceae bacterium AZ2]
MIPNLPTPHLKFRTGSWRTARPVLQAGRCTNCLICWLFCPEGCIRRGKGYISIDLDYCKGCGICVRECPRQALKLVEEVIPGGEEGEIGA